MEQQYVALKRILQNEELYLQPDDLPWANVYVKSVQDLSITYFVKALYVFESGVMVLTPCFKGFIHEGTQLHKHLLEAVDVFVTQPKHSIDELVAVLLKKGKIELLTDDSRKAAYWMKTDNKYAQIYQGTALDENIAKSNPFLAGMGLRSDQSKEAEEQQGDVSKTQSKAAKKPPRTV